MDILNICFSKTLYFKRIEFNLSQEKMSERCCISTRQYTDLENGKRLPSFKSLVNIIIKCDIDLGLFIQEILETGYVAENQN